MLGQRSIATQPIATQQSDTPSNAQNAATQGSLGQYTFTSNHANIPGRAQAFDMKIFKVALSEREQAFNAWQQAAAPNMEEGDRALLSKLVSFSGQEPGAATAENFAVNFSNAMALTDAIKLIVQKYGANVNELAKQFDIPQSMRREFQHLSVSGAAGEAACYLGTMADRRDLRHIEQINEDYGLNSHAISGDDSVTPAERISAIYHIAFAMKKHNFSL